MESSVITQIVWGIVILAVCGIGVYMLFRMIRD